MLCEDLNSNTVFKLLILVWSNEGMNVLDLGYEKSLEKFSITPICDILSSFPACDRKLDLTQLDRRAHMCL